MRLKPRENKKGTSVAVSEMWTAGELWCSESLPTILLLFFDCNAIANSLSQGIYILHTKYIDYTENDRLSVSCHLSLENTFNKVIVLLAILPPHHYYFIHKFSEFYKVYYEHMYDEFDFVFSPEKKGVKGGSCSLL